MGYTTQGYRWVILKSRTHLLGWFRYYPGVFAQISTLSWPCRLRICQRTHRTHMLLQSQNLKPNRPPFPSVSHQSLFFSSFFFLLSRLRPIVLNSPGFPKAEVCWRWSVACGWTARWPSPRPSMRRPSARPWPAPQWTLRTRRTRCRGWNEGISWRYENIWLICG